MTRDIWRWVAVMASIVVVGVGLRFSGLQWDEGSYAHPDERYLAMVADSIGLPGSLGEYFDTSTSPMNPYNRGHSFFVYGTLPLFMAKVAAAAFGLDDFGHLYLVGRGLSALFDSLTILFTFLLGSELYSRRVGAIAALLVCVCALHIQHAHFFVVDSFLTFFCVAALLFAARFARALKWSDALLSGMAAGSALACKVGVIAVPVLVPLGGVIWLARQDKPARRDWAAVMLKVSVSILAAYVCFRVFQPYAFSSSSLIQLNPDFTSSLRRLVQLASRPDFPPALQWHGTSFAWAMGQLVVWGLGVAAGVAAAVGLCLAIVEYLRDRRLAHGLPIFWVAAVVLFFGLQEVRPMRYMLPAYPVLFIVAAYALWWKVDARNHRPAVRWRRGRVAVLALVCGLSMIWGVAFSGIYRSPFPRAEATRWIRDHVPEGSTVANEEWDEDLPALIHGRRVVSFRTVTLKVFESDSPSKIRQLVQDLDAVDYLFINSQRGYGAIPLHPDRYPSTIRYYELLFTERLGFAFRKGFTNYPRFLGFEINTDRADESLSVYDHPKVLVFEKRTDFDAAEVLSDFDAARDGRDPATRDRLIDLTRQLISTPR